MKIRIEDVFEVGKKYTTFRISGMAMTGKQEFTVTGIGDEGSVLYKQRGCRKQYILKLRTRAYESAPLKEFDGAVFEGWDQPVTCDTDGGRVFRGNACYNFVGLPETIKAWIDGGQLNPNFDRSRVVAVDNNWTGQDMPEIPVYPELYECGKCAPLDRMMAKIGQTI